MRLVRSAIGGFVAGAVLLTSAWAGVGVGPVGGGTSGESSTGLEPGLSLPAVGDATAAGARLPDGQFLVGAAKRSLTPDPDRWIPDDPRGTCPAAGDGCLITFDGRWATRILDEDEGVWARAIAISNGETATIWVVLDLIGWFYGYPEEFCGDCGAREIRAAMGSELGLPADQLVIASQHTHASADTLSDIPSWYYEQVRDAIKDAMRDAYATMRPAAIDVGVTQSRINSRDRRIVSRAVPDNDIQWLQAVDADGDVIAVVYNYAAHPTVLASNDTLHAGFAGPASDRIETTLGAEVALFFPSGLGNRTVRRGYGREGLGHMLADAVIADVAERPRRLADNTIRADVREVDVPGDNLVLLAARTAEIFVRSIDPPHGGGPLAGSWGKNQTRPACTGAGPLSVRTTVGGIQVGETAIMLTPGEIFSTISLVAKDYLELAETVFVFGLANDQLGYIIPANEFDLTAQQGPGLAANSLGTSEYEEVLSLHRCAGELVMDELVDAGRTLGFVS